MVLGAPQKDKTKEGKDFKATSHCTFVFLSSLIPSPPVIMGLTIPPLLLSEFVLSLTEALPRWSGNPGKLLYKSKSVQFLITPKLIYFLFILHYL